MGRLVTTYLDGERIFTCCKCNIHLALYKDIVSKDFHGRLGKAYLFEDCVNVSTGPMEDRILITGMHTVADIYCNSCRTVVGWKYEAAFEETQEYKVGKFIIEKMRMQKLGWS
mmetsp:Transcript_14811/g.58099  ORF Transcript_14811/g.58099 Transcript_14811/m.58099 type:complete len:113 (+) Transcript_14811:96-434(+)